AHLALVVDDEDPALAAGLTDRPGHRLHHRLSGRRELDDERRALAELALDVELRVVAGHDAVDDAETKAGAALALGGEERIEDALAYVFTTKGERGTGLGRSEEHTSELQSPFDLVFRLLLGKKKLN